MNEILEKIREDVTKTLEDSIFISIEDVENSLGDILEVYLVSTELMDYWINLTETPECYQVHVGLQFGEHEYAKFYRIDSFVYTNSKNEKDI